MRIFFLDNLAEVVIDRADWSEERLDRAASRVHDALAYIVLGDRFARGYLRSGIPASRTYVRRSSK